MKGKKEICLMEIAHILWDKFIIILASCIVGGLLAGYITAYHIAPQYTASISMYVYNAKDGQITINDMTLATKLANTYIVILKSGTVLKLVTQNTGLSYSISQLGKMISAKAVGTTGVIQVEVTSENMDHARAIAKAIEDVAPKEIIRVVKAGSVEIIDPPEKSPPQTSPDFLKNLMIGVFTGAALSIGIVLLIKIRDQTIKKEDEIVAAFEYPLLSTIPGFSKRKKARYKDDFYD